MTRREVFVGRKNERAAFQRTLRARGPTIIFLYGPVGVGKTTLTRAWVKMAGAARFRAAVVDGRRIAPTAPAFLGALGKALGRSSTASPLARLGKLRRRQLIVVDTYEALANLDGWMRESLLPSLSEHVVLVLAGRHPPAADWRRFAAGSKHVHLLSLRNLDSKDSRRLLRLHHVPSKQHRAILDFTHGHPLALALVAELLSQRPTSVFTPESAPQVVRTLLDQFLLEVGDPAHRAALEVCALVQATTESLLAAVLDTTASEAHRLFEWLAARSFVEAGPDGLFPHDLAREVIASELRWRSIERYKQLTARAHAYYAAQRGQSWKPALNIYFLHRHNPIMASLFRWPETDNFIVDGARVSDVPALRAIVRRHEGEQSARIADHWFSRQLENVRVVRRGAGEPVAFILSLIVDASTPRQDIARDLGARAMWRHAERRGVRPDECVSIHRFSMTREGWQDISYPELSLCFAVANNRDWSLPRQAMSFMVAPDAEFWDFAGKQTLTERVREAEFDVGGHHYGVYVRDWRRYPPVVYLEKLLEMSAGAAIPDVAAPALVALGLEDFGHAVQKALRDLHHPIALRENPLLYSRLIIGEVGPEAPVEDRIRALRKLIRDSAARLRAAARPEKFLATLEATYLVPAPVQEEVAERLGVPYTTYRYRLTHAVTRLVELLWEKETGSTD